MLLRPHESAANSPCVVLAKPHRLSQQTMLMNLAWFGVERRRIVSEPRVQHVLRRAYHKFFPWIVGIDSRLPVSSCDVPLKVQRENPHKGDISSISYQWLCPAEAMKVCCPY